MGRHGWRLLAATRTWAGCCWCGGAVLDWCAAHVYSHRSQSQCEQLGIASALRNAPCFVIKSHCHARPCVHACVSAAGVHVCGGAAHDVNAWCRPAATCATMHATHATWLSHAHARHAACARRLHGAGAACFWLSRQCFCSRGVFAAAANVFALCLLGEPNVFACVWSQI